MLALIGSVLLADLCMVDGLDTALCIGDSLDPVMCSVDDLDPALCSGVAHTLRCV